MLFVSGIYSLNYLPVYSKILSNRLNFIIPTIGINNHKSHWWFN